MAVSHDNPQISLLLRKNISRGDLTNNLPLSNRFAGSKREIELADFLGEGCSVTVANSVREPCGMFSITFVDRVEDNESVYGLVEPMDVVEIRMARNVSHYDASYYQHMPILMRGFISEIRRDWTMTASGPRRTVTISGQDYGKILQILQIMYLPNQVVGQDLLTNYNLLMNYNVDAREYVNAADFIGELVKKVVWPFLDNMGATTDPRAPVMRLGVNAADVGGAIAPMGTQQFAGGTMYDLMKLFGDVGPFAELFVRDLEDGPELVYRALPFKAADGGVIATDDTVETVTISDRYLIGETTIRSDANVANYFWVDAARYNLVSNPIMQAAALTGNNVPNVVVGDHPNSAVSLYGLRMMHVQTQQGARLDGLSGEAFEATKGSVVDMVGEKRRILVEMNKDNVLFENGSMALMGDERIRHGMILKMDRGVSGALSTTQTEHYAVRVQHQFVWGRSYTTTVDYERGTGFISRVQLGRPALAELNIGATYAADR